MQASTSRFSLESRKADLQASIRRMEGELEASRRQLSEEAPIAQQKYAASQTYRDSLADLNRKLGEAYARGLAEGHPEVQRLKAEKQATEALMASEMHAGTSAFDRQSNASYQALKSQVDTLQARLKAAHLDLANTDKTLDELRKVVGRLPRVEQQLADLTRAQDASSHLRAQLFEKLKQAELQLNLERVSAESRYEVSPPRLVRPKMLVTIGVRCGIGILMGLLVAAVIVLFPEGRKVVRAALAAPDRPRREAHP